MSPVTVTQGTSPLILGQPHCGAYVPDAIFNCLNTTGRELADTDWHVDRLYDGLVADVSVVRANFHRYVIDANRSVDGAALYTHANTTALVPVTNFEGALIWEIPPDQAEISERIESFYAPYHGALKAEIERVTALHGFAVLFDCHSIRSEIPYLFEGALPDLNIGTYEGRACAPMFEKAVAEVCAQAADFSSVLNGRFKGGWTTRHYGQPDRGVHAIQLELSQALYLESEAAPFTYSPRKAETLRPVLRQILEAILDVSDTLKSQDISCVKP